MNNRFTIHTLAGAAIHLAAVICMCSANNQAETKRSVHKGVTYTNPRVYNIEYSFEMFPDPNKIDRSKDLKLWVPIPREWDSQKAVNIISVEPEPHGRYVDPEYGNPMLFWDFGKDPEKPSYKVNLKYRSEHYDVHSNIDPNRIGPYDRTSKDYILYTRSTNTVTITDKVKQLARVAVGDEKNPYLQAKRIYEFVREKMYYRGPNLQGKTRSVESLLDFPLTDKNTDQEYYLGICYDQSMVFVALCRAAGIPARNVFALWDNRPWDRTPPDPPDFRQLSIDGLAISLGLGIAGHGWAEIYLPNYGWVPVDPTFGRVGRSNVNNRAVIISKGRDVQIGPNAPQGGNEGYGHRNIPVHEGKAGYLLMGGVFHASHIQSVRIESLGRPDPFPADALAEYATKLHPKAEAEKNLDLYRKRTLRWIDQNTREHADKTEALARAYEKEPRARYEHGAFICQMLGKVVGDKKFSDIVETYTDLRVKSGEPVSTDQFRKIAEDIYGRPLDWFFKQWVGYTELPQLQLEAVTFSQGEKGWHVYGILRQLNKSLFRLPVELVIETEKTTEYKTLWLEKRNTDFEFWTINKPKGVSVDPNNDILQIREMPPLLNSSSYEEIAFCVITDQDKADWYDWSPLHFAAEAGKKDIVQYLIAQEADVNTENIRGEAPLQFAADKGHKEVVELLIKKGADVNASKSGYTPLYWAVWDEDSDMAVLLVSKGADVNFKAADDWPLLHYPVSYNDRELVELFIAHGAKLDTKDEDGWTALRHSVSEGYRDLVEFLVSKGAAGPEFHLAACMGNIERVKSLVEKGMDVDVKDELGWTPLYWAASTRQEEVAEFLINKGANINVRTNDNRTLVHQAARSGAAKLAELLTSKGGDSNSRDKDDSTPLHSAAAGGHKNIVQLLIAKGAEVEAKQKSGDTPLHKGATAGHVDVVEILLANGADVNEKNSLGRTALTLATNEGHTKIVELLRKHGAKE